MNGIWSQYHLSQCIAALKVEVKTGLRHSQGSVLALVQQTYGVKARTKAKALEELKQLYYESYGHRYGEDPFPD